MFRYQKSSLPTHILLALAHSASFWQLFSTNKHKIINYWRTSQHTKMIMSLNWDFDALSNEGLLAQVFQVVPKSEWGFWGPLPKALMLRKSARQQRVKIAQIGTRQNAQNSITCNGMATPLLVLVTSSLFSFRAFSQSLKRSSDYRFAFFLFCLSSSPFPK